MTSPSITLFITEEDVKAVFTSLQENVDSTLIVPHIQKAQQIYIEQKLGVDLSDAIKAEIDANTLVDPYRELVEQYIAPTLAYYSLYLAIPYLHLKMTQKGILLKASENSSNASLEEITFLRNDARDSAEFYLNRMINYLEDNKTTFTLYNPDKMKVNTSTFRGGILIPKRK